MMTEAALFFSLLNTNSNLFDDSVLYYLFNSIAARINGATPLLSLSTTFS